MAVTVFVRSYVCVGLMYAPQRIFKRIGVCACILIYHHVVAYIIQLTEDKSLFAFLSVYYTHAHTYTYIPIII